MHRSSLGVNGAGGGGVDFHAEKTNWDQQRPGKGGSDVQHKSLAFSCGPTGATKNVRGGGGPGRGVELGGRSSETLSFKMESIQAGAEGNSVEGDQALALNEPP